MQTFITVGFVCCLLGCFRIGNTLEITASVTCKAKDHALTLSSEKHFAQFDHEDFLEQDDMMISSSEILAKHYQASTATVKDLSVFFLCFPNRIPNHCFSKLSVVIA